MTGLTKGAIITSIISIIWLVIFGAGLKYALSTGEQAELIDYIVIPILGLAPLIAPIILWIKVAKDGGTGIEKKKFIIFLILFVVCAAFVVLSILINRDVISVDINKNYGGWIVLKIFSVYACSIGWGLFLYYAYRRESEFNIAILILFSAIYVLAEFITGTALGDLIAVIAKRGGDKSNFAVGMQGIANAYLPVVTLIGAIIKKRKDLPDWCLIILFAAGPLVAVIIPLLFLIGYLVLLFTSGGSGSTEETETHYYVDDAYHSEIKKFGSGASEHWEDSSGKMYKDDGYGNLHEVDDPYDD